MEKKFNKGSNIESIKVLRSKEVMVDFTVEDTHSYYAEGLLTHNCGEEVAIMASLCLSRNQKILTKRGNVKIEDITTKDEVMTPNGWERVKNVFPCGRKETVKATFSDGTCVECADTHPFAVVVDGEICFKRLQYIQPGDEVVWSKFAHQLRDELTESARLFPHFVGGIKANDVNTIKLQSKEVRFFETMYDIEVESHCYYIGGVVTHNSQEHTWMDAINNGEDVHMACYDDQTEILTDLGFIPFQKLTSKHKVATPRSGGRLQFTEPLEVQAYHYRGMMCKFIGKETDLLVTPNHRMYGRLPDKDSYEYVEASTVRKLYIPKKMRPDDYHQIEEGEVNFTIQASLDDDLIAEPIPVPYEGFVYCCTTVSGRVVVRRNNKISICGNSAHVVFGVKDKAKRSIVKTCTFLLTYGGGAGTLAKRLKITRQEADEDIRKFNLGLSSLTRWIKYLRDTARRQGIIFTYFGRPRLMYKYYNTSDPSLQAFGDRTASNSPTQGELHEDTLIITDKGVFPIKKFISLVKCDSTEAVKDYKVWNGSKFCEFGLFKHLNDPYRKLVLSDGTELLYGESHKILDATGRFVFARDLMPGDYIKTSLPEPFEYQNSKWDDGEFYLTGYYLSSVKNSDGSDEFPHSIYQSSLYQRSRFLRGLFDSKDYQEGPQVILEAPSKKYALGIKLLLSTCGFHSIYQRVESKHYLYIDRKVRFLDFIGIYCEEEDNHSDVEEVMVVSNNLTGKSGDAYCLSLWDDSHQYEALGLIHHNCLPVDTHFEAAGKAIRFKDHLVEKFKFQDGREGITSGRRLGPCYFVMFKSGDFAVTEESHGFIYDSRSKPLVRKLCDGLDVKVLTSKLQSKQFPNLLILFRGFLKSNRVIFKNSLKSLVNHHEVVKNRKLSTYFFLSWLFRMKFSFNNVVQASSFRSIASVFGYNFILWDADIMDLEHAVYKLSRKRKNKVRAVAVKKLEDMNVASVTMTSGFQVYDAQGFLARNTGADLMRLLMAKIFQKMEDDPEFKENVQLPWHVHDEINCYVKKDYLFKFFYILRDLMWVRQPNWGITLKTDCAIGTTWGDGVVAVGVTKDNKLIVKGLNDTPEVMRQNREDVKAAGLKWEDEVIHPNTKKEYCD